MNKKEKEQIKKLCKNMPVSIKIQSWLFRNSLEIKTILISVLTSVVINILLLMLEIARES